MSRRNPLAISTNSVTLASDTGTDIAPPLFYDYDRIAEEHRSSVMLAARRIKFKAERAKNDLLDIGKELIQVKERLDHGQFSDWIETEFGMSQRTAQNMMGVWRTFGDKSETVSLLTDSALYLLSGPSVPAEAREQAIEEAKETGHSPTKARVQEIIATHKPPPRTRPEGTRLRSPMPLGDQRAAHALEIMATGEPFGLVEEPTNKIEPQDFAAPLAAPLASQHNSHIHQLTAALTRIQQMDFNQYSNITGDWSSPRKLSDIAQAMIHKLKGNIR